MPLPLTVLWRKLDSSGHDACRLLADTHGYQLKGTAVFLEAKRPCELRYEVVADADYHTRSAVISGFIGGTPVDLRIRATRQGRWMLNGVSQPQLSGCIDLDLGFTPATNLLPLRRLALKVGQEAQAPAAYLAFPRMKLIVLPQRYKRLSRMEYDYESPSAGYRGTLRVSRSGFIISYPDLFIQEPAP